jgi:hypothetical protein
MLKHSTAPGSPHQVLHSYSCFSLVSLLLGQSLLNFCLVLFLWYWGWNPGSPWLGKSSTTEPFCLDFAYKTCSQGFPNFAQAGFELLILLPLPPTYWDYRHAPPCLVYTLSSHCFGQPKERVIQSSPVQRQMLIAWKTERGVVYTPMLPRVFLLPLPWVSRLLPCSTNPCSPGLGKLHLWDKSACHLFLSVKFYWHGGHKHLPFALQ